MNNFKRLLEGFKKNGKWQMPAPNKNLKNYKKLKKNWDKENKDKNKSDKKV